MYCHTPTHELNLEYCEAGMMATLRIQVLFHWESEGGATARDPPLSDVFGPADGRWSAYSRALRAAASGWRTTPTIELGAERETS